MDADAAAHHAERAVAEGALGMARKDRGILQRELVKTEGTPKPTADVTDAVLDLSSKLVQHPAATKAETATGS